MNKRVLRKPFRIDDFSVVDTVETEGCLYSKKEPDPVVNLNQCERKSVQIFFYQTLPIIAEDMEPYGVFTPQTAFLLCMSLFRA